MVLVIILIMAGILALFVPSKHSVNRVFFT